MKPRRVKATAVNAAPANPPIPSSGIPSVPPGQFGGAPMISPAQANANDPAFTPEQVELIRFRNYNPLVSLNAHTLQSALDSYLFGYLTPAAKLWDRIAKQHKTIRNVKAKREEAVALRSRVIERTNDSPEAFDQQAVLEHFYANARATHATKRSITGGFSKIAMHMMEAKSFGTAAHHLIWKPDSSQPVTLPSGKTVPSLTATFEYVPMEFFEERTGELRFLGMTLGYTGAPLEDTAWMIAAEESPLMFAGSVLAYYDKLATADLINFSEKFGTPGLVVHTTAQRGTPEGDAAAALTKSLGSNYRGTQFGAAENKVEIVWPSGGTSGSELPMHTITEDVKRDLASLWLGADLSTQSRGGSEKSVGASVQQDGEERRERADCAWISETLNASIDPIVIRWYFGDVPILARVCIDAPKNEDRTILANLTQEAVSMGAKVPIAPVMKRLNVPLAKQDTDEECFTAPATPLSTPDGSSIATNVRQLATNRISGPGEWTLPDGTHISIKKPAKGADSPQLGKLLAKARHTFAEALHGDMAPLLADIRNVLAADDANFTARAAALEAKLRDPEFTAAIIQAGNSERALVNILSAACASGLATEPAPTK